VPEGKRRQATENLRLRASEQAQREGRSFDDVLETLRREGDSRPYRIEYVDADHGFVYTPEFDGLQIVLYVNKRHPFFHVLYGSLLHVPGGGLAKEAIDLLLIALAKGELSDNEQTAEIYRVQRETLWSPFLATSMRDLERRFVVPIVEEEVESDEDEGGKAAA